jgi:hypothetical protein
MQAGCKIQGIKSNSGSVEGSSLRVVSQRLEECCQATTCSMPQLDFAGLIIASIVNAS